MRILARWLVGLSLCLASAHVAAWDVLFRGDSRDPAVIFRDGFAGAGSNRNVLAHISGSSCWIGEGAGRSAFVATTEVEAHARRYGREGLSQRMFVYRIVPDADAPEASAMFDARAGLADLDSRRNALRLDLRVLTAIERMLPFHATHGQHSAELVPARNIQSVDIYEVSPATGNFAFVRNEPNPRFVRPARVGSRGVFTARMDAALEAVPDFYLQYDSANATTSCLADCASSSSMRTTRAANAGRCAVEAVFLPGNRFQRVLDTILD